MISRNKLAAFAASLALGAALFAAPLQAQEVKPTGPGERHANEAPGVGSSGGMMRHSSRHMKRHRHHAMRSMSRGSRMGQAESGVRTGQSPAAIGISGRDKQTGAPKDKD